MRCSSLLLATLREPPNDAEIPSHSLMIRGGFVRKLSAGLYNWLPLGLRVLNKVKTIIREEMDASGAQEVLMPLVHPAEFWQESGRWEAAGPELLRLRDRHDRDYCLAPTHEEVITDIARRELTSYRQLPVNLYQIQLKFRDEVRPRFGVMRAREFIMMDGYSFHLDDASLAETYREMYDCYSRILTRMGLKYQVVVADSGNIGGKVSHEFQVLAEVGEDILAVSDTGDYAANLELAECRPEQGLERAAPSMSMEKVSTPEAHTVIEVARLLDVSRKKILKTLIVRGRNTPFVAVVLRGDHELNLVKASKHPEIAAPAELVDASEWEKPLGVPVGSIGPCGLEIPVIVDRSAALVSDFVCGGNEEGYHFVGANWGRDAQITAETDLRNVVSGEPCPDGRGVIKLVRGIEVGHIFQLGTKYSEVMAATISNEQGKNVVMTMGCYGIGVSRLVAAFIEQNYDDKGMIWSKQVAPFEVIILPLNYQRSDEVHATSEALYEQLTQAGTEVLIDDRDERPGVKFADSELIGIPYAVVVGARGLEKGRVELRTRSDGQTREFDVSEIFGELQRRLAT